MQKGFWDLHNENSFFGAILHTSLTLVLFFSGDVGFAASGSGTQGFSFGARRPLPLESLRSRSYRICRACKAYMKPMGFINIGLYRCLRAKRHQRGMVYDMQCNLSPTYAYTPQK